jgi:hypothetical protein
LPVTYAVPPTIAARASGRLRIKGISSLLSVGSSIQSNPRTERGFITRIE